MEYLSNRKTSCRIYSTVRYVILIRTNNRKSSLGYSRIVSFHLLEKTDQSEADRILKRTTSKRSKQADEFPELKGQFANWCLSMRPDLLDKTTKNRLLG